MPQAECQGQAQGAGDAAPSQQGTGANQQQTAPAPDLDDLANLMQGLDSRGKALMDPDVGPHLRFVLTSSTAQYKHMRMYLHMLAYLCAVQ